MAAGGKELTCLQSYAVSTVNYFMDNSFVLVVDGSIVVISEEVVGLTCGYVFIIVIISVVVFCLFVYVYI